MLVTITTPEPIGVTITCDKPEILEIIPGEFAQVTVSLFRDGHDGKSAYQEWINDGNFGTPEDFLNSLKGKSAYDEWIALGNTGSPADFIEYLKGDDAVNNTLEMVRAENPAIDGNIDANSHTIVNLRNATAPQEPITKTQADSILAEAKAYADTVSADTVRWAGFWSAASGTFPSASGIRRGDEYEINVAGTIAGIDFEVGDLLRARINIPGQTSVNWSASQGNVQQANETRQGTAKVATPAIAGNENTTNDTEVITGKKLWQNFWQRVLALQWTWNAKQIFSVAPRFVSATASQYLKTDVNKEVTTVSTIPASDVTATTNKNFVTDAQLTKITAIDQAVSSAEKAKWNLAPRRLVSDTAQSSVVTGTIAGTAVKVYEFTPGTLTPSGFLRVMVLGTRTGASSSYSISIRINSTNDFSTAVEIAQCTTGGNFSPEMKFERTFTLKNNIIRTASLTGFTDNTSTTTAGSVNQPCNNTVNSVFVFIALVNSTTNINTYIEAVEMIN